MVPLTRSKTGAAKATATKVETKLTTKRGAATKPKLRSKPKSVPKTKVPLKRKIQKRKRAVNKEPDNPSVFQPTVLPLELFLDIAKYIFPLDLIHLSRATRLFRSIFMRRSAADVWRATFTNIGLPPCPDSVMSEPRYAALMFLEQCTKCHKPATRHVDPIILVRLCYKCSKHMALGRQEVGQYKDMIPQSKYLVPPYPRSKAPRSEWYYKEHYQEILKKRDQLSKAEDHKGWNVWVSERVKFVKEWYEKTYPLVRWVWDLELEYEEGLERLKRARAAEIESRLLGLGWKLVDIEKAQVYTRKWKVSIVKAKLLDDKDWDNILPYFLDALERARDERLYSEAVKRKYNRRDIISNWLKSSPAIKIHINLCWKDADNHADLDSDSDSDSDSTGTSTAPVHAK
ncbi:unnamed protein product, partial [Rhizoctonia solani]